jgi:hypothetical protein
MTSKNNTNSPVKQPYNLKARLRSFRPDTWVIIAIEVLITFIFFYFSINFWIDIARGIPFLGDENKRGYEIAVSIILLLLGLMMIMLFIYDFFFHNYQAEDNLPKKVLRNGHVIAEKSTDISENKQAEKIKPLAEDKSKKK